MIKRNKLVKIVTFIVLLLTLIFFTNYFIIHKIQFSGYYTSKVWGHKANNLDRIKKAEKNFIGFELDLVYSDSLNILDVRHPPEESINFSFEDCLKAISKKELKIWLDIKNLNEFNSKAILRRVDGVIKQYELSKKKLLIESTNPSALVNFAKESYNTCYYIPQLHILEKEKLRDTIAFIKKILQKQPNLAISSTYINYPIMKTEFPKAKKFLWSLGNTITLKNYFKIREVLNDSLVEVLLVTYK